MAKSSKKDSNASPAPAATATTGEEMNDDENNNHEKATTTKSNNQQEAASEGRKSLTTAKTYEERCQAVNCISQPLASKKTTKKLYKLVQKASAQKYLRRGVKELVKGLRKGETGLAVLAGDIYPIDVMSHLPILLEERNVPYLFVPSKQDLGAAASTKRPTSCVLIKTNKEWDGQDLYNTLMQEAKEYNPSDKIAS